MPARSKSQQRLFGAVHAYNEGKFHGSRAFRKRVAALARHISAEDARHFAETPHVGLPEKKSAGRTVSEKRAQVMVRPETMQELYAKVPAGLYNINAAISGETRSARRRSFLGSVLYGAGSGAVLGGLGAAGLGALAVRAAASSRGLPPDAIGSRVLEAALRCGLWGAGRGAAAGSAVGAVLNILGKVRR